MDRRGALLVLYSVHASHWNGLNGLEQHKESKCYKVSNYSRNLLFCTLSNVSGNKVYICIHIRDFTYM